MFYIIINIIMLVISIGIVIGSYYYQGNNYQKIINFINKHYKILISFIFLLVLITTFYHFGILPDGIHVDEAGMFYDALSISKYGVDRYLNHYPIYLINYGGGQSAMYAYLSAVLIKIFGYNVIFMRLPAAILRIIAFICAYLFIKDDKDKVKTIIYLWLLAIIPYFIMQSRWGLDCNLLVNMMMISVSILYYALKKRKKIVLFLSGISLGLTLYTYALSYIIIPIFILLLCTYLLYIKKINIKELIILGIPIFILAIPLILMILINNGYIEEIKGIITIPKLYNYRSSEIGLPKFENIHILYAIFSYDYVLNYGEKLVYNATPYFGTIYYLSIPFALLGLYICLNNCKKNIKNKKINKDIIMLFWFISVLLCMFIIDKPNINKANAIFIPLIYFIMLGINKYRNKKIFIIIIFMYMFSFLLFNEFYFNKYNDKYRIQNYFATDYLDALEYTYNQDVERVYVYPKVASQSYIYPLLHYQVSPYEFNKNIIKIDNKEYIFTTNKNIKDNELYIVDKDILEKIDNINNYNIKEFNNIYILSK